MVSSIKGGGGRGKRVAQLKMNATGEPESGIVPTEEPGKVLPTNRNSYTSKSASIANERGGRASLCCRGCSRGEEEDTAKRKAAAKLSSLPKDEKRGEKNLVKRGVVRILKKKKIPGG